MSAHKDRDEARLHAIQLYAIHGQPICPNCKTRGSHFAPPSLGEPGFFICGAADVPRLSTEAECLEQMGDGQPLDIMREIK